MLATAYELGSEAVAPARFALFSAEPAATPGFSFAPFTATTPVRWTRGFRLPIVATESLWGVLLSAVFIGRSERIGLRLVAGAVCIVAGGALIAVVR